MSLKGYYGRRIKHKLAVRPTYALGNRKRECILEITYNLVRGTIWGVTCTILRVIDRGTISKYHMEDTWKNIFRQLM